MARQKLSRTIFIIAIMMIACFLQAGSWDSAYAAEGETASGTSGTCTWTFDGSTLTLSGGKLGDWRYDDPPWYPYHEEIKRVVIEDKVTLQTGYRLFYDCSAVESIDTKKIDTSGVKELSSMFWGCESLTSLDISGLDTSSAQYMGAMFAGCKGLTSLDVSTLDTSNATDLGGLFSGCESLTSIDVSDLDTSKATFLGGLFSGCKSLKSIDISTIDSSNATYLGSMFSNCSGLKKLDLSTLKTSNVYDMSHLVSGCTSLTELNLDGLDTSNVAWMEEMFSHCEKLKKLDLSSFDTSNVQNMSFMFAGCTALTEIDLKSFRTPKVEDMHFMFHDCENLKTLDLSRFDTSKVKDMWGMFEYCYSLYSLDVSNFDTSNVENIVQMFDDCVSLTKLDLSSFDVSQITEFNYIIGECEGLEELKIGKGFNANKDLEVSAKFPKTMYNKKTGEKYEAYEAIPSTPNQTYVADLAVRTSTDFRFFDSKYRFLYQGGFQFSKLKDIRESMDLNMYEEYSKAIPGLKNTNYYSGLLTKNSNSYVPQGLCRFGNYYLITAYDGRGKLKDYSMLYVLDLNWKYIMNITLPNRYHNGGIAYDPDGDVLWFCGNTDVDFLGNKVEYLAGKKLRDIIKKGTKKANLLLMDGSREVTNKPSCLDYKHGRLWVGNFTRKGDSQIIGYKTSGTKLNKDNAFVINTRLCVNGFTFGNENDLYVSYSSGRYKGCESYVERTSVGTAIKAGGRFNAAAAKGTRVQVPRMNEEILVGGDHLYVLYESAATEYYGTACVRTDRITAIDLSAWRGTGGMRTLFGAKDENKLRSAGDAETITAGEPVQIDYYDYQDDAPDLERTLAFQPAEDGNYKITIGDMSSAQQVFVTGEITDAEGASCGQLTTAGTDETESGIRVSTQDSAEAEVNLLQGNTYYIDLTACAVDMAGENSYSGQYTVLLESNGAVNKALAEQAAQTEQEVAAGGSSCFEFTPETTGTYRIEWTSLGMLSGCKVMDEGGNSIEMDGDLCNLEGGKTYRFLSVLEDTYDTEATGQVQFCATPLEQVTMDADQCTIDSESVVQYTPDATGRFGVTAIGEGSENVVIMAYDEAGALLAQGSGFVAVDGTAGETCRLLCTSVTSDITLQIDPYRPDIAELDLQVGKVRAYNGTKIYPTVKISEADQVLVKGTDYTVTYPEKPVAAGTYRLNIKGIGNYSGSLDVSYTIPKAANTLKASGKSVKLKAKKLKKKAQSIKPSKAYKVSGAKGTVTYTKVKVNKKKFAKKFTVNKKTGKITVKKGVKKGVYKLTVNVKAAGNKNYKPLTRKVVVTIRVK